MGFFLISFVAGILTVLSPCVLPLLPIIIGGTTASKSKLRPLIITASLAVSIIVFTLILKASTALINVPPILWQSISGGIVIIFGILTLFPNIWDAITARFPSLGAKSGQLLGKSNKKEGIFGAILVGAALGPVFSSCSPTYAIILASVLPANYAQGVGYLISYALGLGLFLLLIGYVGQELVLKLGWAADPRGLFKRIIGALFIIVGIGVISGYDKTVQTYFVEHGINATRIEQRLNPKEQ